jgi:hypothetical protein
MPANGCEGNRMRTQPGGSQIYLALLLAAAAAVVSTARTYGLSPAGDRVFLAATSFEIAAMAGPVGQDSAADP